MNEMPLLPIDELDAPPLPSPMNKMPISLVWWTRCPLLSFDELYALYYTLVIEVPLLLNDEVDTLLFPVN